MTLEESKARVEYIDLDSDDIDVWVVGLNSAIGMAILAATLGVACGALGAALVIAWCMT